MKLLLAPDHRYSGLGVNGSSRNKSGHFLSKAALQEPSRARSSWDFLSPGRGGTWRLRPLPQLQCSAVHLASPALQQLGCCPSGLTAGCGGVGDGGELGACLRTVEPSAVFPAQPNPKAGWKQCSQQREKNKGQCSFYIRISSCFSWEGLSLV